MKLLHVKLQFVLACSLIWACNAGAEEIKLDYHYEGDHQVDFSNIRRGPLKVDAFTDERSGVSPNLLTDSDLDGMAPDGYTTDKPLADLVHSAIVQALNHGNAELVDSDENMTLQGSISSTDVEIVDRGGVDSFQITIRTSVQLRGSGRTIWQTVLFGRGIAPVSEGIETALAAALDRTVRGLVGDDYFLMEVI